MRSNENVSCSLAPLKEWYCDSCGEVIGSNSEGWLEWYHDNNEEAIENKEKGFRIVHDDKRCVYDSKSMYKQDKSTAEMYLNKFTGPNGLVYLLSKIQDNDSETNVEVVEIIRRLHVPYYEEARKYHGIAKEDGYFDGENETTRYTTGTSTYILNNYKGE